MLLRKAITLAIATWVSMVSAKKNKIIWKSRTRDAIPKELVSCMSDLKTMLKFEDTEKLYHGYECGGRWWQIGSVHNNRAANYDVWNECEKSMLDAASMGVSWLQCVKDDYEVVAWSPTGPVDCWLDDYERCLPASKFGRYE